jgi:hypothetical protein
MNVSDRRDFLKKLSLLTTAGLTAPALSVFAKNDAIKFDGWEADHFPPPGEDIWDWVRMQFITSPQYIYLNIDLNQCIENQINIIKDLFI